MILAQREEFIASHIAAQPESFSTFAEPLSANPLLLKVKRFYDAEAVILDTYEGMGNQNEAQRDALGRTKRSSARAGKVDRGELAAVRQYSAIRLDTGVSIWSVSVEADSGRILTDREVALKCRASTTIVRRACS